MDLEKHVDQFMKNVTNEGFSRQNIHDWATKLTEEARAEELKLAPAIRFPSQDILASSEQIKENLEILTSRIDTLIKTVNEGNAVEVKTVEESAPTGAAAKPGKEPKPNETA